MSVNRFDQPAQIKYTDTVMPEEYASPNYMGLYQMKRQDERDNIDDATKLYSMMPALDFKTMPQQSHLATQYKQSVAQQALEIGKAGTKGDWAALISNTNRLKNAHIAVTAIYNRNAELEEKFSAQQASLPVTNRGIPMYRDPQGRLTTDPGTPDRPHTFDLNESVTPQKTEYIPTFSDLATKYALTASVTAQQEATKAAGGDIQTQKIKTQEFLGTKLRATAPALYLGLNAPQKQQFMADLFYDLSNGRSLYSLAPEERVRAMQTMNASLQQLEHPVFSADRDKTGFTQKAKQAREALDAAAQEDPVLKAALSQLDSYMNTARRYTREETEDINRGPKTGTGFSGFGNVDMDGNPTPATAPTRVNSPYLFDSKKDAYSRLAHNLNPKNPQDQNYVQEFFLNRVIDERTNVETFRRQTEGINPKQPNNPQYYFRNAEAGNEAIREFTEDLIITTPDGKAAINPVIEQALANTDNTTMSDYIQAVKTQLNTGVPKDQLVSKLLKDGLLNYAPARNTKERVKFVDETLPKFLDGLARVESLSRKLAETDVQLFAVDKEIGEDIGRTLGNPTTWNVKIEGVNVPWNAMTTEGAGLDRETKAAIDKSPRARRLAEKLGQEGEWSVEVGKDGKAVVRSGRVEGATTYDSSQDALQAAVKQGLASGHVTNPASGVYGVVVNVDGANLYISTGGVPTTNASGGVTAKNPAVISEIVAATEYKFDHSKIGSVTPANGIFTALSNNDRVAAARQSGVTSLKSFPLYNPQTKTTEIVYLGTDQFGTIANSQEGTPLLMLTEDQMTRLGQLAVTQHIERFTLTPDTKKAEFTRQLLRARMQQSRSN
jgi:hypothetical protein